MQGYSSLPRHTFAYIFDMVQDQELNKKKMVFDPAFVSFLGLCIQGMLLPSGPAGLLLIPGQTGPRHRQDTVPGPQYV